MTKIIILVLTLCWYSAIFAADTTTLNLGLTKPEEGSTSWGPKINADLDLIDTKFGTLGTAAYTPATNYEVPLSFSSPLSRTGNSVSCPTCGTGSGSGDFSSNTSSSVDGEIVLFSGTAGKTAKRATGTGVATVTSGVFSATLTPALGTPSSVVLTNATGLTATGAASGSKEGTGTKFQMFAGSSANTGDVPVYDANHNLVTSGSPPLTMAGSNTQLLFNAGGVTGAVIGATSDGTNLTAADGALRATNPWIATGILDGNGAPRMQFASVPSAVNTFKYTSAAAGNPATIIMEPSDGVNSSANVHVLIKGKGTGSVCFTSCNGLGTVSIKSITFNGTSSGSYTLQAAADVPGGAVTATLPLSTSDILGAEVDGHASGSLTAANCRNTTIYNTGQAASDVALTLPTAAAGLSCLFTVGTARSNKWGVQAGASDKIYLLADDGTISAGSDNGFARMQAAQIGQSFACWTFKTDAYDWQCKAIAIGTSTFAAS